MFTLTAICDGCGESGFSALVLQPSGWGPKLPTSWTFDPANPDALRCAVCTKNARRTAIGRTVILGAFVHLVPDGRSPTPWEHRVTRADVNFGPASLELPRGPIRAVCIFADDGFKPGDGPRYTGALGYLGDPDWAVSGPNAGGWCPSLSPVHWRPQQPPRFAVAGLRAPTTFVVFVAVEVPDAAPSILGGAAPLAAWDWAKQDYVVHGYPVPDYAAWVRACEPDDEDDVDGQHVPVDALLPGDIPPGVGTP